MKKLTLEEMQELAESTGGRCLSTSYVNSTEKLKWQCGDGHVWGATPNNVRQGHWCPYCAGKAKLTIEDMQELAESRRGKCLSTEYVNAHTKLKWQCRKGHVWEAIPNNIKQGRWCPYCAGKKTIEDMRELAESRGGKCLSTEYVNIGTKLKWQCRKGHVWEALPSSIKQGRWCPYCAGNAKLTIEDMQEIAESRGGKCLSTEYTDAHTKLKWGCSAGHVWEATPNNVKNGTWCPYCAGKAKLTIEYMQELAESRGGKCLSKRYTGVFTKLKWQCRKGHVWEALPSSVNQGHWCSECAVQRRQEHRKPKSPKEKL